MVACLGVGIVGQFFTRMTPGRRLFWTAFNVVMAGTFGYAFWTIYSEYETLSAARAKAVAALVTAAKLSVTGIISQ